MITNFLFSLKCRTSWRLTTSDPFSLNMLEIHLRHVMRKPVLWLCDQQRCRSACASAQSDQHLCCSLLGQYNISRFYNRNFKPLLSFCVGAGRFVSTLVGNPEDRFSRDEAHLYTACPTLITYTLWVASWQNQQNWMCAQRRLRSAWASALSDQSLRCVLSG